MAYSVLGLDLGSKYIKIVLAKQGKKLQLVKTAIVPTPQGSIMDGEIRNVDAVAHAVKNALLEKRMKAGELYISINSPHAVIREIKLPALKKNEIEPAVEFELSQTFPGIAQTHTIGYRSFSADGEAVEGIAAFCPTKILDAYVELGKHLGIPVKSIDVNANSIAKAFSTFTTDEKSEGPVIVIDIGCTNSQVNVISGDRLLLSRHISSGASSVDSIVASRLNISIEQAERARVGSKYSLYNVSNEDMLTFARLGFSAIEDQIRQTIDYYTYNKANGVIGKILLVGGGSTFSGLDRYLQETFNMPVKVLYADIKNPESKESLSLFFPAIGACITFDEMFTDINLLPYLRSMAKAKAKAGMFAAVIVSMTVLALLAAGIYAFMYVMDDNYKSRDVLAQRVIKKYSVINDVKNAIVSGNKRIEKTTQILKTADTNSISNVKLLTDVGNVMPDNIFAVNFVTNGKDIIGISGISRDRLSIADFAYKLKSISNFEKVTLKGITTKAAEAGKAEEYNFALDIKMKR